MPNELSAEQIAEIRRYTTNHTDEFAEDYRALLAHIDALTQRLAEAERDTARGGREAGGKREGE